MRSAVSEPENMLITTNVLRDENQDCLTPGRGINYAGQDLSLRGRKAVAISEALGDCQWDRHLAGHSDGQARRLSYQNRSQ